MAAPHPPSVGWYGKLPSRGDFVGRGLPRAWQHTWDDWLQRGLAGAATRLGAAPLRERLAAMHPWQMIVLAPPPDAPVWWGVVVTSTDRVGRAFPLLVAQACDPTVLDRTPLADLQERAGRLIEWLDTSRPVASPREFEAGWAQLAATPWPPVPVALTDTNTNADVAALRAGWPQALSFWWCVAPDGASRVPLAEGWPPREDLVLDWLGVPA